MPLSKRFPRSELRCASVVAASTGTKILAVAPVIRETDRLLPRTSGSQPYAEMSMTVLPTASLGLGPKLNSSPCKVQNSDQEHLGRKRQSRYRERHAIRPLSIPKDPEYRASFYR